MLFLSILRHCDTFDTFVTLCEAFDSFFLLRAVLKGEVSHFLNVVSKTS